MGKTLAKLFTYPVKILAAFFLKVLPEVLRLIILSICIIWKYYKLINTNFKYISTINKKTLKFSYKKREKTEMPPCIVCLSDFADGEEGREIIECGHVFHRHCLEKWMQGYAATCPLCRSLVLPEVIVSEYQRMQIEKENYNGIEKELALILLNALHGGSCNGFF